MKRATVEMRKMEKSMKIIQKLTALLLCALLLCGAGAPAFAAQADSEPQQSNTVTAEQFRNYVAAGAPEFTADCGAALLLELNSGTMIYSLNAEQTMYPASLTKIMTCMLALEYGRLDDVLTVSESALSDLDEAGSTAGLMVGEQMKLKDVLYCLMLSSANEACNVVAEYISGDVPAFVTLMNKTAQDLGCKNTHYENPHGLHASNHYTTAKDLSIITRKALTYEDFREISSTATYTVPATNMSAPRKLKTTNYLISTDTVADYFYPDAIGIKTGYTSAAGRCVISRASDGNLNLLAIVLNADTEVLPDGSVRYHNFIEAKRMFDYGFDNFAYAQVLSRLKPIVQVPVQFSEDEKGAVLIPSEDVNSLLPKEYDKAKITTEYTLEPPSGLTAPLRQGQDVGTVSVLYDGHLIGQTRLETLTAVEVSGTAVVFQESKDFIQEYRWAIILLIVLIVLLLLFLWLRSTIHRSRRSASRRRGGRR